MSYLMKVMTAKHAEISDLDVSSSSCVIVWVKVVLKRTVVGVPQKQQQFFSELPTRGRSHHTSF